jgi:hypothetical protein
MENTQAKNDKNTKIGLMECGNVKAYVFLSTWVKSSFIYFAGT